MELLDPFIGLLPELDLPADILSESAGIQDHLQSMDDDSTGINWDGQE
jgi:hypothetical protein